MNETQTKTHTQTVSEKSHHGEAEPIHQPQKEESPKIRAARIKTLNDVFRQTFIGGRVVFTQGIQYLEEEELSKLVTKVRQFKEFDSDNDPHGEHDFGIINHNGKSVYWKVDYYDRQCLYGSEDPSNPDVTTRVLTIMLASEY